MLRTLFENDEEVLADYWAWRGKGETKCSDIFINAINLMFRFRSGVVCGCRKKKALLNNQ